MGLLAKVDDIIEQGNKKVLRITKGGDFLKKEPPSIISHIEEVQNDERIRKNFFRPSMFHGCKRQNVFHYLDSPRNPQQIPNKLQRILDNGTAIHSVLQNYLAKHPDLWFVPEAKVDLEIEGARVRGSCDGIIVRRKDLYRWGLEIKTINDKDFKSLKEPLEHHVSQASIYAVLSKVWWITILYWNKNNQDLKEFHVPFDEDRWNETKSRLKQLKSFVDEKKLPPFEKSECDITFCGFVDICRKNGGLV